MNISFSASTFLWTSPFGPDALPLIQKVSELGFDAIEIAVEDPELIDCDFIAKALEENNLKCTLCGAFGPNRDLTHENESVRKEGMAFIQTCIKLASSLGSALFTGPMYSAVGKARMVPEQQRLKEWDRAVKNLREICLIAEDQGVQLAIEPLNRFETDLVNRSDDVIKMVQDINHPSAKICLDGFHMHIEDGNIKNAILAAKENLVHVQVSESHRGISGTGSFDWVGLKNGLEAIDYNGHIVIESFTTDIKELAGAVCFWRQFAPNQDTFAKQSLHFLKNHFQ